MPVFSYTVVDQSDEIVRGTIDGDSPRQARDQLRGRGWKIVDVHPVPQDPAAKSWGFLGPRRESNHVGTFTGELATLLAVGIPLHDCLATLSQQYTGSFKQVVLLLKDQVASGKPLSGRHA